MKASEFVIRARNLADLANSDFILYNDELMSLYESYRDIYAAYVQSDSDFFIKQTVIQISDSYLSPYAQSGLNEWLVPMPSDCMRLRWVEYNGGPAVWIMMDKFPIRNKNAIGQWPRYRWQGQNLWIVGSSAMQFNSVRVGYYPEQPVCTVPDQDYAYGQGITSLANVGLVSYPTYSDQNQSLLYVYNGTSIEVDSRALGTYSVVLYTGASAISYLCYYAGYIYFLMGGDIYRAPYLQTGTLVPVKVTSVANLTSLSVSTADQKLYYSDGTNLYSSALDGSGQATVTAASASSAYALSSLVFYVDSSNALKTVSGTTLTTAVQSASTDGSTYLFYLDTAGSLWSSTVDTSGTTPVLANQSLLRSGISTAGPYFAAGTVYPGSSPIAVSGRIPVVDNSMDLLAISSAVDYDLSFPDNEANEILAYQMAIDFRRKQGGDISLLAERLGQGKTASDQSVSSGLWARFEDVLHRDDMQPERTAQIYARRWF